MEQGCGSYSACTGTSASCAPHLARGCGAGQRAQHLPKGSQKRYWGRPSNPAQPLSSLTEAGDQIKCFPSSPMFLLNLIINQSMCLLSCHGVFKCVRGHEFQKQTAWHLFPTKSHQKEAKRQSISNISVSFPRRVRSVLGHCCASVRALPVSRQEGAACAPGLAEAIPGFEEGGGKKEKKSGLRIEAEASC